MDIASIVYRSADVEIPERINIHIDEKAELEKARPRPVREPRPVGIDTVELVAPSQEHFFDAKSDRSISTTKKKRESYDMSGSVFLISKEGKTIDLPIPSSSRHDPLNWSARKTAMAMFAIGWSCATGLTAMQAASLMMKGIEPEFTKEVCFYQTQAPRRCDEC